MKSRQCVHACRSLVPPLEFNYAHRRRTKIRGCPVRKYPIRPQPALKRRFWHRWHGLKASASLGSFYEALFFSSATLSPAPTNITDVHSLKVLPVPGLLKVCVLFVVLLWYGGHCYCQLSLLSCVTLLLLYTQNPFLYYYEQVWAAFLPLSTDLEFHQPSDCKRILALVADRFYRRK